MAIFHQQTLKCVNSKNIIHHSPTKIMDASPTTGQKRTFWSLQIDRCMFCGRKGVFGHVAMVPIPGAIFKEVKEIQTPEAPSPGVSGGCGDVDNNHPVLPWFEQLPDN
jgi:hypothetical protein